MNLLRSIAIVSAMIAAGSSAEGLTLDECQQLAQDNYPLIKRYGLIESTTSYDVSNITKGYLPQLAVGAQATWQSEVVTLPETLQSVMSMSGIDMAGLRKDQYQVSVDLSQVVYDGGKISASRDEARARGEARLRGNDVDLYSVRRRVCDLYFGVLLLDENIRNNELLRVLLGDNCRKLEAMLSGGTAMQSDVDAIRAELLNACQREEELTAMRESYLSVLALFIGQEITEALQKPDALMPAATEVNRPEMRYFDAMVSQARSGLKSLDASVRPTLSLFARAYYGYPGYDMYEDMMRRRWSLNAMVGVRLSWNVGSLYTLDKDRRKIADKISEIENQREEFLFNNRVQSTQERAAMESYRRMLSQDDEIIRLRQSVRVAAEAKLTGGVIDVNNLLQEITRENQARVSHATHEIEMLQSLYHLKNTLNQ